MVISKKAECSEANNFSLPQPFQIKPVILIEYRIHVRVNNGRLYSA